MYTWLNDPKGVTMFGDSLNAEIDMAMKLGKAIKDGCANTGKLPVPQMQRKCPA